MTADFHVELRGVSKQFGGVQALDGVGFGIRAGTVHALVGENGAGKSTLGRILAGALAVDGGSISVDGHAVHLQSPRDALHYRMTGIAQELALLPARTVLENVFLANESRDGARLDIPAMRRRYRELATQVGFDVPADMQVRTLRTADQQKVEILRALARNARLIVLDEPTSSLPLDDARRLLAAVRRLASAGTTIVFVSHNLSDVLAVADVVTVLKDGRHVSTGPAAGHTQASIVGEMLGRSLARAFPVRRLRQVESTVEPALAADGVSSPAGLQAVSLRVAPGEIVGVAGLVGSGRSELLRVLFGADTRLAGSVRVGGQELPAGGPSVALRAGMVMLPENRKDQGLLMRASISENITLAHLSSFSKAGVLPKGPIRTAAAAAVARLGIKAAGLKAPVWTLSGGNQQKVLFGRCLLEQPIVLLADEPTRGVDVGAKLAIYELMAETAATGVAILFVSSEMEEILSLPHRVLVMCASRIAAELTGADITERNVLSAAFGAEPHLAEAATT